MHARGEDIEIFSPGIDDIIRRVLLLDKREFQPVQTISRHFPDSELVGRDLPSLEVLRQRNSIASRPNGKTLAPLGRNSLRSSHLTSILSGVSAHETDRLS
jgi:hypothetical protein